MGTEELSVLKQEIAEIIFNSDDFFLDELVARCNHAGFPVDDLLSRLSADINTRSERDLRMSVSTNSRREFLEHAIEVELMFYAEHPEMAH
ncbi:MAG: hypothetical protein QM762_24110 [Chryseolinea sp.]